MKRGQNMQIIDRLFEFFREKALSNYKVEQACGLSNGYLRNLRKAPSAEILERIFSTYPELSREWVMYGSGEMLRSSVSPATETQPRDDRQMTDTNTNELRRNYEGTSDMKRLPLVTQKAVAGFGNADFAIHEADVKEYYIVPKFRYHQVDFMIEISGSSMYPKYNSGDVVACTILHDGSFIQWNKCHIVATREQGILCKRLMPGSSDDCLKMVSDNENYPPFEVPKDEITGIALVVGVIRLE